MTQKIRPPAPTQPQSPLERQHGSGGFKAPDELPEIVRAPDIGGRGAGLTADEEAIDAAASGAAGVNDDGSPVFTLPATPPGALSPDHAAAARASHGAQNRLGLPAQPNEAERLWGRYQSVLAAHRERYAKTRDNSLEPEYLAAREDCIRAGLIKADP